MLTVIFLITGFFTLYSSAIFPGFCLVGFSPLLTYIILKKKITSALSFGCFLGMIMDLLSSDPVGVHAINYTAIVFILHRNKKYFSLEKSLHVSILTYFVAALSTLLQAFLLFLFDRRIPFTGECLLMDVIIMPVVDAGYAWIAVTLPVQSIKEVKKWVAIIKHKYFLPSR